MQKDRIVKRHKISFLKLKCNRTICVRCKTATRQMSNKKNNNKSYRSIASAYMLTVNKSNVISRKN